MKNSNSTSLPTVMYGFSSDILGFVVEKAIGQSLESYLYVFPFFALLNLEWFCDTEIKLHSQEVIFRPLGMSASFYLTPDVKARLVDLTYRKNGNMEAWAGQSKLIEQDPTKGKCVFFIQVAFIFIPFSVRRHMGGVGLYASLRDYLTLLRHMLQIHGKFCEH